MSIRGFIMVSEELTAQSLQTLIKEKRRKAWGFFIVCVFYIFYIFVATAA